MSALAAAVGQLGDYRRLLAIRDYRLLWAAQVVSTFGDRLTQLALAALVYGITGSEVGLGLVLTISEAPRAILGLFAGTVADRVSRKTLLVATDCVRAALVLVLALWVGVPLAIVYLLTSLHAMATVFFSPARYAVLPDIVPRENLLDANTLDETTQGALDPIAFLAGGALVGVLGARARLRRWTPSPSSSRPASSRSRRAGPPRCGARSATSRGRSSSEVAEGVRVLFADRILRANTLLMLLAGRGRQRRHPARSTCWRSTIGRRAPSAWGSSRAGLAIGFVLGALVCGAVVDRIGKGLTILLGLIGTGACRWCWSRSCPSGRRSS